MNLKYKNLVITINLNNLNRLNTFYIIAIKVKIIISLIVYIFDFKDFLILAKVFTNYIIFINRVLIDLKLLLIKENNIKIIMKLTLL